MLISCIGFTIFTNKDNNNGKDNTENYKFTDENVNKFPQLKYTFKKNKNGKYYLSDIVNLNFEEDYENCN